MTTIPPMYRTSAKLLINGNQIKNDANVSTTTENSNDNEKKSLSPNIYHIELPSSDDEKSTPHYVSCLNIKPNYQYNYYDYRRRRRTSSLPSSTIIFDLAIQRKISNHRSSSLNSLTRWQNNPYKIISLFNRQYHCQPISEFDGNRILLANSTHIDIYNLETGQCDENLRFQSPNINYIATCYNKYKNELLVASTSNLYIYDFQKSKVKYDIILPGYPFSLDHNHRIRYLACNMSSIYHGYFSFTSTCTSTVLSRLSQYGFKHVCDLEFDDGTMHGLHAFENYIGVVIRYGRYSSKQHEEYSLYVYDSLLDRQFYMIDLNDIGCITCLTGYERTLDWILCDFKKQRIIFVNQESTEFVQFNEKINQCKILDESNYLVIWLADRIFIYTIE
ncbi:unnamed protein product [Rotaria magnacalcarata]|uniref:Uncharacterized protein n=2 Tax=Rotaria magnacalcarata TaxID=392030 RepID=A0A819NJR3_9BILA|nr:unnamed protein product [Rotaria magnacalcarata]